MFSWPDSNKQVFYARNEKGQIVGRQLMALSEEEKLVCFSVYPNSVAAAIRQLFREYDFQLAQALRIPHVWSTEDYSVANILSRDWKAQKHRTLLPQEFI